MPEPTLTERVENLERKMELLEGLPDRVSAVELQIGQLRSEMREQFSAVRQEFRTDLDVAGTGLRGEIRDACEALGTELRKEIREGDEETRRYMRVLHEELRSRIPALQEALPRRRRG